MKNLRFTFFASPFIAVAVIGLCYLTQWGAKAFFGIDLPLQNQLLVVKQNAGLNLNFLILVCQILLLAPILEEILFRLILFKLPVKLFRVRKAAIVVLLAAVGSAIFSAAHYPDWLAISRTGEMTWMPLSNAFLALFAFGLAQCWLYRKTTWLWSPMLNHFIFNLINLILLFVLPDAV